MLKKRKDKSDSKISSIEKKYTQFSKKVVTFCLINLIAAELFVAVMIYHSGDTSSLGYFLTSICIECMGCIIWYMKNSEAEKVARIKAEVEKEKLNSKKTGQAVDSSWDIDKVEIQEFGEPGSYCDETCSSVEG